MPEFPSHKLVHGFIKLKASSVMLLLAFASLIGASVRKNGKMCVYIYYGYHVCRHSDGSRDQQMDYCRRASERQRPCSRPEDYVLIPNGEALCPECEARDSSNPFREPASESRALLEHLASEIRRYRDDGAVAGTGTGPSSRWPDYIESRLAQIDESARRAGPRSRYNEDLSTLYRSELGPGEAAFLYAYQGWDRRRQEQAAADRAAGVAALMKRTRQRWRQGR